LAKELSPKSHIIDLEFTEKLDAEGFVKVILPACLPCIPSGNSRRTQFISVLRYTQNLGGKI
jgi:archaellum component FlaD/FlaE